MACELRTSASTGRPGLKVVMTALASHTSQGRAKSTEHTVRHGLPAFTEHNLPRFRPTGRVDAKAVAHFSHYKHTFAGLHAAEHARSLNAWQNISTLFAAVLQAVCTSVCLQASLKCSLSSRRTASPGLSCKLVEEENSKQSSRGWLLRTARCHEAGFIACLHRCEARGGMKLLTHNFLACNVKGVKNGWPLGIDAQKVEVREADMDPGAHAHCLHVPCAIASEPTGTQQGFCLHRRSHSLLDVGSCTPSVPAQLHAWLPRPSPLHQSRTPACMHMLLPRRTPRLQTL